jgi:hypothetical protein
VTPPARSREERKRHALTRLERDVDAWVATAASEGGVPHLVPLSFLWDGECLLIATPSASPTGSNLEATGTARLGIGATRDVVLIEGTVVALAAVPDELGDAFALKTGFDPRRLDGYAYFRIRPQCVQAWREENELKGRDLMRGGEWI